MSLRHQLTRLWFRTLLLPMTQMGQLTCGVLLLLLIELGGRLVSSDWADALFLTLLFIVWNSNSALSQSELAQWFRRWAIRRMKIFQDAVIEWGVDLRGDPPIPRALPPLWPAVWGIGLIISAGLLFLQTSFPTGLRSSLAPYCYLAYLVVLGSLWLGLVFMILMQGYLISAEIHDWFLQRFHGQGTRSRRKERLTMLGLAVLLLIASQLLPLWLPVVAIGLALAVGTGLMLAANSSLTLLWRRRKDATLRSFDGRWLVWAILSGLFVLTADLILLSRGRMWTEPSAESLEPLYSMPITLGLGKILEWITLPGLFVLLRHCYRFARLGWFFNPERDFQRLQTQGVLVPESPDYRQWEIQQRRVLVRGFNTLFHRAARVPRDKGTGIWIGLQHWYITGISRDATDHSDEEGMIDGQIGRPFHLVFTREARLHFWQICQALQIDLILVEDGISFRRFVKVLRMMFEIYDIHGGRQIALERHFTGLPGTRVIIHEFGMGQTEDWSQSRYPEPNYQEIGRGRILHIFKDRGESEILDSAPEDFEGLPVLLYS